MITTGGHLGLGCTELPLVWRQLRSIFQACRTRLVMWMSRQISWKCLAARARTSIFLHDIPVTATTSDKHGRRRQSSQAARGQRKSLRNFFGVFVVFFNASETSSTHSSCPTHSAWLKRGLLHFLPPCSPPPVLSARSPHASSHCCRLSRWHFQKAAETSWCFRPAREKMTKWGTGWVEEQISSENERLIRFTGH